VRICLAWCSLGRLAAQGGDHEPHGLLRSMPIGRTRVGSSFVKTERQDRSNDIEGPG